MGRKSSLTDKQWEQIGKRLLVGKESARSIAREFGISEAAVRRKFPAQRKDVKDVANQIVATDAALRALPIASQIDALTLADELKAISMHMASAAKYSSASSHRLAMMANGVLERVDPASPMKSHEDLTAFAALKKLANMSSVIPIGLMSANKEVIQDLNREPPPIREMTDDELRLVMARG